MLRIRRIRHIALDVAWRSEADGGMPERLRRARGASAGRCFRRCGCSRPARGFGGQQDSEGFWLEFEE
eukprot:2082965-Rhodomonas_salina.1